MTITNKDRQEIKGNPRLSFCSECGKLIFKLDVEVTELSPRQWWHENDKLDYHHEAKPGGEL